MDNATAGNAGATPKKLRPRDRDAIIQSLRAGVTPRKGLQHIQVGRAKEVSALVHDIERIVDGGAAFRLVIGEFGAGKSFFLQLVRSVALEKGLVTVHADLAPDRRLHSTTGLARTLYAELMRNMATRGKPDGQALPSVVERFVTVTMQEADAQGEAVATLIKQKLTHLSEWVGGYSFAKVIEAYWRGHDTGNEELKANAVRWLRGEYTTRTDARKALGVRTIVDDINVYDHFKLMALFVRQAGYKGLLINLDEMVNLYKLTNRKTRENNYEQLLRMLNDCLQGTAEHMGFLMGGTPEFLMDTHRGLYSYEALHSRLAENTFARQAGVVDYTGPVLHLASLTPEELYILLKNLRHVYAKGDPTAYLLPDEALEFFLQHCSQTIGSAYFRTPRHTIREFVALLSTLEQNPGLTWRGLIKTVVVAPEADTDLPNFTLDDDNDDEGEGLANFKL